MIKSAEFTNIEMNTSELIPYAKNSRTHTDEHIRQIAASIREFGFTVPVIVDEVKGIIAGHGRVRAAVLIALEVIPCRQVFGWSEAQKIAYCMADNQLPLNAQWDQKLLEAEIQKLMDMEFDIDLLGFDDDFLLNLFPVEEGLTDPDEVPDLPEAPVTVLGDIWQLGDHRLMCGDSTSIDAVETLMDKELADQLITDPPYNIAYVGKTSDALTIKNDNMSDTEFRQFLVDAYKAADAVMKPGAVFYIWHADSESYNFRGAALDMGWINRQCLIWKKNHMTLSRQDFHWQHEPVLYGWKDGAAHLWASDRKQTTILEFDRPQRSAVHPTMKPVDLIEYLVLNNTKGKDIVLDLFGGSGTTMIACHKTGRKARMMELGENYCDVIINRWQDYTGESAVHCESGKTFAEEKSERS